MRIKGEAWLNLTLVNVGVDHEKNYTCIPFNQVKVHNYTCIPFNQVKVNNFREIERIYRMSSWQFLNGFILIL